MFLLDTNVVSELRKSRPHGGLLAWLKSVDDSQLYLASITLGEIQSGIERVRHTDARKASELDVWLDQLAASPNILPMDGAAFRCWALLMHGKSDTLYEDAMIAAVAVTHRLTVVTRNTADFKTFPVRLLNPFIHGVSE